MDASSSAAARRPRSVDELLTLASALPAPALRELATIGRRLGKVPSFDGRCLDPAYLDAVATGHWSEQQAFYLTMAREAVDRLVLDVPRWHRHAVKQALSAVALGILLTPVPVPSCQSLRERLLQTWDAVTRETSSGSAQHVHS